MESEGVKRKKKKCIEVEGKRDMVYSPRIGSVTWIESLIELLSLVIISFMADDDTFDDTGDDGRDEVEDVLTGDDLETSSVVVDVEGDSIDPLRRVDFKMMGIFLTTRELIVRSVSHLTCESN